MRNKTLFLVIILSVVMSLSAMAQHDVEVDHTFRYVWYSNIPPQQARLEAIQGAKIDAVAKEFGTIVRSTTHSSSQSIDNNTSSRFHLDASTVVRGYWVKDSHEPELVIDNDGRYIDVRVRGKIREYNNAPTEFVCEFLHEVGGKRVATDEYTDGEQLWMTFNTPIDGYLAVFSTDADMVCCALGVVKVKANKQYLFFDDGQYGELPIRMACATPPEEYSQQYILFSPNKFSLPGKGRAAVGRLLEYSFADFQKWLGSIRDRDKDMQIEVRPIIIHK